MSAIHGELFTPDQPGEWVTIQQATRRLGISERAIRRRITRGDFLCRTHADGRREVFLEDAESGTSSDATEHSVDPERAIHLVDRMSIAVTRQLDAMTIELAASRDRVESLARENGVLTERVAGLERELNTAREMAARQTAMLPQTAAAAAQSAVDQPATEAELASVRRANQRQVEELARMAAELNAFKLAQHEAAQSPGVGPPGGSTRPDGPVPRPPVQPTAPWWSVWWIWLCIVVGVACFLLIVRVVLG